MKKKIYPIIFLLSIFLILIFTFFDYYKVDTASMLPTIKPGSYIFIIKSNPKIFGIPLAFNNISVKKKEIWLLREPAYNISTKKKIDGPEKTQVYVKRCIGLPGDTIIIKKKSLSELGDYVSNDDFTKTTGLYPHLEGLKWRLNDYGPLYIPRKNDSLILSAANLAMYKILLKFEGFTTQDMATQSHTGKNIGVYKFKKSYYFFLGDNFYDSVDSRHWGPIAQDYLIGRVILIL